MRSLEVSYMLAYWLRGNLGVGKTTYRDLSLSLRIIPYNQTLALINRFLGVLIFVRNKRVREYKAVIS